MQNKKPEALPRELKRLSEAVEKSNKLWFAFVKGIVRGIGMAIGATVIAAIVLTILWRIFQSIGLTPILQSFGIDLG